MLAKLGILYLWKQKKEQEKDWEQVEEEDAIKVAVVAPAVIVFVPNVVRNYLISKG